MRYAKLMKHLRLQLVLLFCGCLILQPHSPSGARAQDNPEDGKKVFDSYTTVTTMVYPPAGAAFKATSEMLDLFGYFGSRDLVGEAIEKINARLDVLEQRVDKLETDVRAVRNAFFQAQNLTRVRLLRAKQDALKLLLYKLQQGPTERREKLALAREAQIIANGFLSDPDLWMWSDMRDRDGAMLTADFKPLPALEFYVVALVTWMTAVDQAADGDGAFAGREHGRDLKKHIDFLSVRADWAEDKKAVTLPESIKVRVSCTMEPFHMSPRNGRCSIHEWCEDRLALVRSTVEVHEVPVPPRTELCNVPPTMSAAGSEAELERTYGTEVMDALAGKLDLLMTRGYVRESFVGTFGKTPPNYQPLWVYAIKDDGDMLWYRKDTADAPWQGPQKVGNGWDFKDVIPAGGNSIYALTADGRLMWYRHDGFNDGSRDWPAPVEVGHGWAFSKIFSGGEGIIYAIKEDGDLVWYRHGGYADGGGPATWAAPKTVGARWNGFKDVFSNGGGDIYVVRPNGELVYYHQPGYATGEPRFLKERVIATGWQNVRQIIPAGGGVILTVTGEGKLLWYRHYFKANGPLPSSRVKEHWEGPTEIGSGWVGFKKIIALLPVSPSAPVVR